MQTLTFYDTRGGWTRAHISANAWEDDLGLSTDKQHVVGILNSSPIVLAITDKWEGDGRNIVGILPDGTRFNAWPVTPHDLSPRAARRISRKKFLGWLPENEEVISEVQILEGEAAIITLLGTTSKWVPAPIQHFLFDETPDDWFDVDEVIVEEPEEIEVLVEIVEVELQYKGIKTHGLQYYFPYTTKFLEAIGNPIPEGKSKADKMFFHIYADPDAKRITLSGRGPEKNRKGMTPSLTAKVTAAHSFLGTSAKYESDRETHVGRLRVDDDGWDLVIDLTDSRNFDVREIEEAA